METFTFCVITFEATRIWTHLASQNDCLNLSSVKDDHTYGKKMARNGRKTVIYEEHSFRISLYYHFLPLSNCLNDNVPKLPSQSDKIQSML